MTAITHPVKFLHAPMRIPSSSPTAVSFRSSIRASTFRRTLAAVLVETIQLTAVAQKKLTPDSERALTVWMLEHLSVSTYEYADRDGLGAFEDAVLARIDPSLNLQGVPTSPARRRLKELRSALGQGTSAPQPTADHETQLPLGSLTRHEELVAILEDHGGSWMTTKELATAVQRRGRYKKRDGTSDVTAFQVHGRTKNYPHVFERDGTRVRPRAGEDR